MEKFFGCPYDEKKGRLFFAQEQSTEDHRILL